MIDSKELRIGNWVHVTAMPVAKQIIELCAEHCIIGRKIVGIPYEDLSPIPLTAEILEKTGMVNYEKNKFGDWCDLDIVYNETGAYKGFYTVFLYSEVDGSRWLFRNIKYLHEWQNIYYSKTQTELKVEL